MRRSALCLVFTVVTLTTHPALSVERALLKEGVVFPGGEVFPVGDGDGLVIGEHKGVSYSHTYSAIAWASVANMPGRIIDIPEHRAWNIRCYVDNFADLRICTIMLPHPNARQNLTFVLEIMGNILCVGANNYAGRLAVIRVDKNKPVQSDLDDGCYNSTTSEILISQMLAGDIVHIRYYKAPQDFEQDVSVSSLGLNTALDLQLWMLDHLE